MGGAVLALLVWRVLVVLTALVLGFGLVAAATAWGFGRRPITARRACGACLGTERGKLQLRHARGRITGTHEAASQLRELS